MKRRRTPEPAESSSSSPASSPEEQRDRLARQIGRMLAIQWLDRQSRSIAEEKGGTGSASQPSQE